MITFETWKEMTEEKPQHVPLCSFVLTQQRATEKAWSHNVGSAFIKRSIWMWHWLVPLHEDIACMTYQAMPFPHEISIQQIETLLFSFSNHIAVAMCLLAIIHRAFLDPLLFSYLGFYRHFYWHTWKFPHEGPKNWNITSYSSAPISLAKQQSCWILNNWTQFVLDIQVQNILLHPLSTTSNLLSRLILTLSLYEVTETNFKLNYLPVSLCIYLALILQ